MGSAPREFETFAHFPPLCSGPVGSLMMFLGSLALLVDAWAMARQRTRRAAARSWQAAAALTTIPAVFWTFQMFLAGNDTTHLIWLPFSPPIFTYVCVYVDAMMRTGDDDIVALRNLKYKHKSA